MHDRARRVDIRRARGRSPVGLATSRGFDSRATTIATTPHTSTRIARHARTPSARHAPFSFASHAFNTAMIAQRASTTRTIATPTRATEARRARVVANAADRKMWCVRTRSADRGIGEEELRRGRTRGRRARATRRATRRCARDGVGRIRDTGYLIWRAARDRASARWEGESGARRASDARVAMRTMILTE